MRCPRCKGQTRVTDSREQDIFTRRRRVCVACGGDFKTMEMPVGYSAEVIVAVTSDGMKAAVKKRQRST